jgi:hypothetical protein
MGSEGAYLCTFPYVGPELLKEAKIKEEKVKCELHRKHSD